MKAALVTLGVLAALVASGSATVEQATNAGMKGVVPFALVVLLEVVNVAGTWAWMSDDRAHVQREAAAGVGVASVVTGTCGVLSYGLIGVVPAVGVLFTVHLVGRLRHRSVSVPDAVGMPSPQAANAIGMPSPEPEPEPIAPAIPAAIPEPSEALPGSMRNPTAEDDADRVADLRAYAAELGRMPGRDAVKARYGVGSSTANRLRAAAERPSLHLASGGS